LDHGLLAVDVLAGLQGVNGDLGVGVVRRGDDDGVDVVSLKDFPIILGGEEFLAVDLLGPFQAAYVEVGRRQELDPRVSQCGSYVVKALDAHPDTRQSDGVIGAHFVPSWQG
jgi:arginase family enzyme